MKRSRRTARIPDSHPGLFDAIEGTDPFGVADIVADEVARLRRQEAQQAESLAMDPAQARRAERLMFVSFGSGSSGNCAYIGTASQGVLIDAGVDAETVHRQLKANGVDFARAVQGIILTHDHGDHVRFAYPLLRRTTGKYLWATPKAFTGILRRHNISRRIKDYHKPIYKEFAFEVGPLTITPFETSHDGTDNVGFAIAYGTEVFVVATDMGTVTDRALHYMSTATVLMVEANYDSQMLATGRYPLYLQARIRGARGHMDNLDTGEHLARLWTPALHHVFLCHLSEDNNTPELALHAATAGLERAGATVLPADAPAYASGPGAVRLMALPRFDSSPPFFF